MTSGRILHLALHATSGTTDEAEAGKQEGLDGTASRDLTGEKPPLAVEMCS